MGEATQVSSLPLPPMQYVGLYTDENVQRGRAPSPPRPLHEGYSMFGAPFHGDEPVIRPLESQGIRRLYPQNYEHKKELKKLNHSLLVNFLDMIDILIRCPDTSKRLEKKDDMSLLFIHMQHLINEYRPHQARETLRVLLDMQRRQRLDTAHRFHKHLDKVREVLQKAVSVLPEQEATSTWQQPIQTTSAAGTIQGQPPAQGHCLSQDRIMCGIVDAL
ncbi:mediator of RNA polymerase II transcription subunit 7-like [Dermacentor andersoni]|uniref:mediator of RNA polymerase II transcription subunit 7-like n=1 Tax=Dermacentor andersoni TaxID=34620 RepID=UPI0021550479|nr:mediator of RNA polymerase II transcription subunit 7-like [Dermacentor andersoni]XP_050026624.1 mediator of RNA polymerase II transcription subunit 7-like [Dermacentor andersoni]XP_050026626.1 mediator of RNA polymerase II transcription subunit 7-like [Dermacentor andersoni]